MQKANPVLAHDRIRNIFYSINADDLCDMLRFHVTPSQEVFNRILSGMGDLYIPANDYTEELYTVLENETPEDTFKRQKRVKTLIAEKSNTRVINYQNAYKLSWVYACADTFPWLRDTCVSMLWVDRSYAFNQRSYTDLVITASTRIEFDEGNKNSADYDRYIQMRELAIECVLGHSLVRYGASGNIDYIVNASRIISAGIIDDICTRRQLLCQCGHVLDASPDVEEIRAIINA